MAAGASLVLAWGGALAALLSRARLRPQPSGWRGGEPVRHPGHRSVPGVARPGAEGLPGAVDGRGRRTPTAVPEVIAAAEASEREALARRDSVEADRRAYARRKLAEVMGDLEGLRRGEAAHADRMARTDLKAPLAGIVRSLSVTAPGEVVAPGATVAELGPTGTGLVVLAKMPSEDTLAVAPASAPTYACPATPTRPRTLRSAGAVGRPGFGRG